VEEGKGGERQMKGSKASRCFYCGKDFEAEKAEKFVTAEVENHFPSGGMRIGTYRFHPECLHAFAKVPVRTNKKTGVKNILSKGGLKN